MEKLPIAYALRDGAKLLGVSLRKLHGEILLGRIDSVKIGRRRLVTPAALNQYIQKNTIKAFNAADEAARILGNS